MARKSVTLTLSVSFPWWVRGLYLPLLILGARLGFVPNIDRAGQVIANAARIQAIPTI